MIRRDARCAMWTWAATAGAALGLAAALAGQARVFRIKKVGEYPNFIALSGNGRVAYVTSFGTGELLALDLVEKKVVRSVPVGDEPLGLAVVESEKAVGRTKRVTACPSTHGPFRGTVSGPSSDSRWMPSPAMTRTVAGTRLAIPMKSATNGSAGRV